jgi:hypothetical protein
MAGAGSKAESPNGSPAASTGSPWEAAKAECAAAGLSLEATKALVKSATGKTASGAVTMGDLAKVRVQLTALRAGKAAGDTAAGEDIPF